MRRRLIVVSLGVTLMVTLAFLIPLALLTRELARDRVLGAAEDEAQLAARLLSALSDDESYESTFTRLGFDDLTLVLPDGTMVGGSPRPGEDLSRALAGAAGSQGVDGGAVTYVPLVNAAEDIYVVRAFVDDADLTRNVGRSWFILGALGTVLLGLAVFVADRLGQSIVRPAVELSRAAERVSNGDLTARVAPAGPPELVDVGHEFNHLASRIAHLVQTEREAVADLSHRLRTPLTAARLDVESLPPGPDRDQLTSSLIALERTVDHVIHEARRPTAVQGDRCDLAELLRDRTAFWAALAEEQGRRTSLEMAATAGPWWCRLSANDVGAALDALLGNVFAHTPDGTPYRVRATAEGGVALVHLDDAGPGLDDDTLTGRGASGAESTGLGLDIAKRTVEAGGGSLDVGRGPLGGATVTIRVPLGA